MVIISTYNLTFPVETLQLLQPTTNTVVVNLPNITSDTYMGTEILFYKTSTVTQAINVASGSSNVILGLSQEVLTTIYMNTTNLKFVACKTSGGIYCWAAISSNLMKSGSIRFTPTSYENTTTITFPVPFPIAPSAITLSPSFEGTYTRVSDVCIESITTTNFTFITHVNDISVPYTVYWIAL